MPVFDPLYKLERRRMYTLLLSKFVLFTKGNSFSAFVVANGTTIYISINGAICILSIIVSGVTLKQFRRENQRTKKIFSFQKTACTVSRVVAQKNNVNLKYYSFRMSLQTTLHLE